MRRFTATVTLVLAAGCSSSASNGGSGPSAGDLAAAYFGVLCKANTLCVGGAQYLDGLHV